MDKDYTPDEIRKGFRLARRVMGLTQSQVALRSGIADSKLSLWENGLIDLDPAELRRVEAIFNKAKSAYGKLSQLALSESGLDSSAVRKLRRQQVNLNQRELARRAKIPRNKLMQWEQGRIELSSDEIARWESALLEAARRDPYLQLDVAREIGDDLWKSQKSLKQRVSDLEQQIQFHQTQVARLEHSNSLDDPIVQEVIASLRREIVKLEEEKPARVNEAIKKEHQE
jgi:transcriptional regulator with XRE-family HTH domain